MFLYLVVLSLITPLSACTSIISVVVLNYTTKVVVDSKTGFRIYHRQHSVDESINEQAPSNGLERRREGEAEEKEGGWPPKSNRS